MRVVLTCVILLSVFLFVQSFYSFQMNDSCLCSKRIGFDRLPEEMARLQLCPFAISCTGKEVPSLTLEDKYTSFVQDILTRATKIAIVGDSMARQLWLSVIGQIRGDDLIIDPMFKVRASYIMHAKNFDETKNKTNDQIHYQVQDYITNKFDNIHSSTYNDKHTLQIAINRSQFLYHNNVNVDHLEKYLLGNNIMRVDYLPYYMNLPNDNKPLLELHNFVINALQNDNFEHIVLFAPGFTINCKQVDIKAKVQTYVKLWDDLPLPTTKYLISTPTEHINDSQFKVCIEHFNRYAEELTRQRNGWQYIDFAMLTRHSKFPHVMYGGWHYMCDAINIRSVTKEGSLREPKIKISYLTSHICQDKANSELLVKLLLPSIYVAMKNQRLILQ